MFGKIDLSDPSNFEFQAEGTETPRFQGPYQKTFRPWKCSVDSIDIFSLGTLYVDSPSPNQERLAQRIAELYKTKSTSEFIGEMDGLFFLYLYDREKQTHLLINNHYQLTKVFYLTDDRHLFFSNRMDALLDHMATPRPHFPSVVGFLRNGFNQSDETQIKGVKKLLPTFWIEIGPRGFHLNQRWKEHFRIERKDFSDLEKKLDEYESIYRAGLRDYLEARRPSSVALLLSGGHDTSFALIQTAKVYSGPIHCFTTTFRGWGFSEHKYAEHICDKFGGIFHPQEFSGENLGLTIDLILSNEEPVLGSSLPLHALTQTASSYSDTLIGGDGGDTLWGEYFPVAEYHRWVKDLPASARNLLHSFSLLLRRCSDWERFWELEHVTRLFAGSNPYHDFLGRLCTYRHFGPQQMDRLLVPDLKSVEAAQSPLQIDFNKNNFQDALIEGKLYNGFFTYQAAQQTRSIDSFGMELFLPSVQKDIANFINGLPHEWLNGGTTFHRLINSKSINRKFHKHALARYLKKEEIYNRSFDIPWHLILKDRKHILRLLKKALSKRGWYQESYLNQIFAEFESQRHKDHELLELKSHGYRLVALLNLEIWSRLYLDGKFRKPSVHAMDLESFLEN